jgi:predicted Rossmann-fold nucleotide-binding protein
MKKICVFCGSSKGVKPIFSEKAELLADILVDNNIELVYGGSNIGLMKSIADRVLIRGWKVTGVMPANLADK